MIDPTVFLKLPVQFKNICSVYPPSINDIISNAKSIQLFRLLTYSQDDIEDLFLQDQGKENGDHGTPEKRIPTPLEFVLINSYKSIEFKTLIEEAFQFFIHEPITFLYENKLILIGDVADLSQITDMTKFRYLSEETFFDFQNIVRAVMGKELEKPPDSAEDPIVKRIKAQSRRRKRLAEKNREKNGSGISLTTTLGAICCMGIGLTPLNIGEISYASIDVLISLYQQKEKYQTDIDSLMAGANPKKVHPKYWIRDKSEVHELKI